ncbi:MAG: hypothetical protein IPJ95_01190 [Gemmatimonadetes bacterium]|nr:hypothetical protein [Gemmatimonadota bacterium]
MLSATLAKRLGHLAIGVRELPKHDRHFTLDEKALSVALTPAGDPTDTPRVRHDVDCVAAVLTMRGEHRAHSLERAGYVFSTTSGSVVRTVHRWYRTQGEAGCSPIIHHFALTNIAWLKKPAAAQNLKLHELTSLCLAALRPSTATWDRFIGNLRSMRADGTLTDDEAVAIAASELTEPMLASLDDDVEPDAATIDEVIQRVKGSYKEEADAAASQAVALVSAELAAFRTTAETALARAFQLDSSINRLLKPIAKGIRLVASTIMGASVIGAILLPFPNVFESVPSAYRWVSWAFLLVAGGIGWFATKRGATLDSLSADCEARVYSWLRRTFFPSRTR